MKTVRPPGWALILLLLLLGASAGPLPVPEPWTAWLMPGLAVLALAASLFWGSLPGRFWLGGALLAGLIALYAWNPTHEWDVHLGLQSVESIPGLPGSAFAAGSRQTLELATGLLAAFALAFSLSERQIRGLLGVAMVAAAIMAVAVLAQRLEPKPSPVFEYTGIFVNENHFAVFSNLILPVVLAMASRARFRAVQDGRPSSPAGLFALVAVLVVAAVVMCRSRAGMAVLALLVAAHLGLCRHLVRQYPFIGVPSSPHARRLGWVAILLVAALAVAAFAREWTQAGAIGREWAFRLGILQDTLKAWRDAPAWGTGPGTFSAVFPYYQSAMFNGRTILHAHCEPVQFLSEFGMAGGLWVLLAAGLLFSAKKRVPPGGTEMPAFAELERRAIGLGLVACALHCMVDFPLRIPLIAMLAAAWAGAWVGTRPVREAVGRARDMARRD